MKYESSLLGKQLAVKEKSTCKVSDEWDSVMPIPEDNIEYDEDCPPLESGFYGPPVHRFNGRVIPPRRSPLDPFDPEVLAFMKSLTPMVEMEPDILGGMPVFKNTRVPIKRMFDYLLAKKSMDEFLKAFPSVPRATAIAVLENEATLFYEEISIAIEAERMQHY